MIHPTLAAGAEAACRLCPARRRKTKLKSITKKSRRSKRRRVHSFGVLRINTLKPQAAFTPVRDRCASPPCPSRPSDLCLVRPPDLCLVRPSAGPLPCSAASHLLVLRPGPCLVLRPPPCHAPAPALSVRSTLPCSAARPLPCSAAPHRLCSAARPPGFLLILRPGLCLVRHCRPAFYSLPALHYPPLRPPPGPAVYNPILSARPQLPSPRYALPVYNNRAIRRPGDGEV